MSAHNKTFRTAFHFIEEVWRKVQLVANPSATQNRTVVTNCTTNKQTKTNPEPKKQQSTQPQRRCSV